MKSLADLNPGESAIIKDFNDDEIALKLIEMGCLPGEEIQLIRIAPFGDPMAFKVADYILSLRKNEAKCVLLEN